MKAHKGEEIVCNCARPAGSFRHDVEDRGRISSEDIAISLPGAPDDNGCWVCPTCKAAVARFIGDHWQVKTKNGLLD